MYKHSVILVASLLSSYVVASCVHNTSLKPRAEDGSVPISTFGYTGLVGPFNWVGLDAANAACSTSSQQSPINLNSTSAKKLSTPPTVALNNVESAEFENLGSTIEVLATGTTTIDNKTFNLAQFHFHSPSEHRIDEEYFPLEMHMVHEAADGSIAVIAMLFDMSSVNSTELLKSVTENIDQIQSPGTKTETGALNFDELTAHINSVPLLTYTGSLTTPPCAEGLTFIVPQVAMPLDVDTFNKIKTTVKFNARYTQNDVGQENILALGCAAVESAVSASPSANATTSAVASATESAMVTESAAETASATQSAAESAATASATTTTAAESAETVTATATEAESTAASSTTALATASASAAAGEDEAAGKDSIELVAGQHCIAGACNKIPGAAKVRRDRWARWSKY